MTELANYSENKLLDLTLGTTTYSIPTVYAQLHTGSPGEDCTSNVAAETTRKAASFASASGGSASTDADMAWTSLAATETLTHISYWDAASSGNPLLYGALDSSVPVVSGGSFTISSGGWTATFTASTGASPGGVTAYLVDKILDHILGTTTFTLPSGAYVKLHLGAPGTSATSNPAVETTRQSATFSAASGGATSNSAQIQWTSVSATETYTHYSIWDASTGGNPLFVGYLTASAPITAGGDATFAATALDVALL